MTNEMVLMVGHWTEKLFIGAANLYRAELERRLDRAKAEVEGLVKIFTEFQVMPGALVLDLACGIGRHSVALAEKGYRVVGVDLSPAFVTRAKELAEERDVGQNSDFKVGDMRQIGAVLSSYDRRFNAVVNMFTSMGYYAEETDEDVIKQLLRLTAEKGLLIIDAFNRDWLIRHFRPSDLVRREDGLILVEERKLNLENSRMESLWKYYRQEDEDLKHIETFMIDHRIYSLHELKRLVEECGWAYKTCFGGFNSETFTTDSNRLVIVAQKL